VTGLHDESSSWSLQWEVFHSALERPPEKRSAYVAEACPDDTMAREVEALLATHEKGAGPLDRPPSLAIEAGAEIGLSQQMTLISDDRINLAPGTVLLNRFEILRQLGQGGMGTVYEAQDRTLDARVALKMLRPEISQSSSANERFRREIQLARQVTHPNVCRLFDLFKDGDGNTFLSMELLEGETLAEHVKTHGPLEPAAALPIVKQIAGALTAAHRIGIVHRDLKSANVMLVEEEGQTRAVVTDFGLATRTQAERGDLSVLTQTGQLLGTPAFMAPEQLEGGEISPPTDIYALGVVLYEMVTGVLPFEGSTPFSVAAHRLHQDPPTPRRFLPTLDRRWERVILRCLERDPRNRYQLAAEVVSALEGETVSLPPSQRIRRRRRVVWTVVALALVLAGAFALRRWVPRMVASLADQDTVAPSVSLAQDERMWVLMASFDNRTDAEIGDSAIEAALARALADSDKFRLVPQPRIEATLQRMRRPVDTRLDERLAIEVAKRDGQIAVILESRMEQLGGEYTLTVDITSSDEAPPMATIVEDSTSEETIPAAIKRLAAKTRQTLDRIEPQIPEAMTKLAQVTTASMKALQLFTQADAAMLAKKSWVAEELYRQALDEDPEFASAYTFLAHNLVYQGRPESEYLPYARQGVDLIAGVSDTEKLFISGSFEEMSSETDKARASYAALLRLQPDHYWGLEKLSALYRREGQLELMTPWWVEAAVARPDHFEYNARAAVSLVSFTGRLADAEPFRHKASLLMTESDRSREPGIAEFLAFLPYHQAWQARDLDQAQSELAALESTTSEQIGVDRTIQFSNLVIAYSYLGMIDKAEEITFELAMSPQISADRHRRLVRDLELARLDEGDWREVLAHNPIETIGDEEVLKRIRAGMVSEARDLFSRLEPPREWDERALARRRAAEGMLAFVEGRPDDAVALLQDSVDDWRSQLLSDEFFLACETLARAHMENGRVEMAFAVLEDASQQSARAVYGKGGWIDLRFYTAEQHRRQGRIAAAEEVENELRSLLRFVDPDTRWARELEGLTATS